MRLNPKEVVRGFRFGVASNPVLLPYSTEIDSRLVAVRLCDNTAYLLFENARAFTLRSLPEHPFKLRFNRETLKGKLVHLLKYRNETVFAVTDEGCEEVLFRVADEPWMLDYTQQTVDCFIEGRLKGSDMEHYCVAQACDNLSGDKGFPSTEKCTIAGIYEVARDIVQDSGNNLQRLAKATLAAMLHNLHYDSRGEIYLIGD